MGRYNKILLNGKFHVVRKAPGTEVVNKILKQETIVMGFDRYEYLHIIWVHYSLFNISVQKSKFYTLKILLLHILYQNFGKLFNTLK